MLTKLSHRITLIRGDGVGPELAEAAKRCIDALGIGLAWDMVDAGSEVMEKEGTPLPDRVIASVKKNKFALPRYKGMNKVNPAGLILSGVLMLRHIGEFEAAERLEKATAAVIERGRDVTYDLRPWHDRTSAVGTQEMAEAIIRHIRRD